MNTLVLKKLNELNLNELNQQLLAYTHFRLKRLKWRHNREGTTKGREANDYVQEALKLALEGKDRKWNPTTEPDLLKYLKGIISSLVSNAIKSKENKILTSFTPQDLQDSNSLHVIHKEAPVDELLIKEELKQKIKTGIEQAEMKKPEIPLSLIFEAMDEEMKPREIMEVLDLEERIVRNAIRQIRSISDKTINT